MLAENILTVMSMECDFIYNGTLFNWILLVFLVVVIGVVVGERSKNLEKTGQFDRFHTLIVMFDKLC